MFSEKKKEKLPIVSERNVIGKNTSIVGDVISEGDFRIEGSVEGTIKTTGRLVIGETGTVKGKIECENADVDGVFSGEMSVKNLLTLKQHATIQGVIVISKLSVEPGAVFNANCTMRGTVKELNNEQNTAKKSAS